LDNWLTLLPRCGAASFSTPSHLPPISGSKAEKPVMLPPGCARFVTSPLSIGSPTWVKTSGIVLVSRRSSSTIGVLAPTNTSGAADQFRRRSLYALGFATEFTWQALAIAKNLAVMRE
jgi:hypothetical protein